MAYSNDFKEISIGLTNYIGSMIKSLNYSTKVSIQLVVAELTSKIVYICTNKDSSPNMYLYKPVLRATAYMLEQENNKLEQENSIPIVKDKIEHNNQLIKLLYTSIDTYKSEKE